MYKFYMDTYNDNGMKVRMKITVLAEAEEEAIEEAKRVVKRDNYDVTKCEVYNV